MPVTAIDGSSFVRLRTATVAAEASAATGFSADGEVEDHPVTIDVNMCVPDPYATVGDQPAGGTDDDCDGDGTLNVDEAADAVGNPCVPDPYATLADFEASGADEDCIAPELPELAVTGADSGLLATFALLLALSGVVVVAISGRAREAAA